MDQAELDRLAVEAAAADIEKTPVTVDEAPAARVDSVAEARVIIGTVATLAAGLWPFLKPIYQPETVEQLAQAWGPVMEFYGWTAGEILSHPLASAALVTIPIAAQTYAAFNEQEKTKKSRVAIGGVANDEPYEPAQGAVVLVPG